MKRVYLSSPMTGLPELNFPAFRVEAARLRALGFEVVNPTGLNPEPNTGWQRSTGAHLEMHVAHRVGMEIVIAKEVAAS